MAILQVVFVDGFGILHPRRCGSASHLGVTSQIATIGVAKALLHIQDLEERQIRHAMKALQNSPPHTSMPASSCDAEPANEQSQLGAGILDAPVGNECENGICTRSGKQVSRARPSSAYPLQIELVSKGELVGMAVCVNRTISRPVYVSVGHQISLKSAVAMVSQCSRYR